MLLYTVGDSFTYGDELPDPKTQAWPVLLAEKLGYELCNRGSSGVGNNYIVKSIIKDIPRVQPDLVVVAWTSCGRMEFADESDDPVFDIWPYCQRRWHRPLPYRDTLVRYITKYNNPMHQYRSWLRLVVLLQDYLKLRNINYRFVSAFDNQWMSRDYLHLSREYADQIDVQQFVGWPDNGMIEWASAYPIAPGGHPLEQGHSAIAEKIFNSL